MTNYWVVSPNVNNDENLLDKWIATIRDTQCAFMGWSCDKSYGQTFCNDVKIGDVILIAKRENWQRRLVAVGKVSTEAHDDIPQVSNDLEYGSYRRLHPFIPLDDDPKTYGMDFEGTAYGNARILPAIYRLNPENNDRDEALVRVLEQLLSQQEADGKLVESLKSSAKIRMDVLLNFRQIILYGPPGTSKTYQAKRMAAKLILTEQSDEAIQNHAKQEEEDSQGAFADKRFKIIRRENQPDNYQGQWAIVQFHPAYNYEDFVRGIQVSSQGDKIKYENVQRIFSAMCKAAEKNTDSNYVLIIDEINRAPIAAVLGELIYGLEYRNARIATPYAIEGDNTLSVPRNLYIIGTMNTADRSIGHIDYAVRRRFAFVGCGPELDVLRSYYRNKPEKLKILAESLFEKISKIFVKDNLNELDPDDVRPGHTYFMAEDEMKLWNKLVFQIYPLLREYYKDGILKQMVKTVKLSTNTEIHLDQTMSFNEWDSLLTKLKEESMDNGSVHNQS